MKNELKHIDWDFFANYYYGNLSDDENKTFESWLHEDVKHQKLYSTFVHILENKNTLEWAQNLKVESALNKIKGQKKLIKVKRLTLLWRIAASIIIVVGLSFLLRQLQFTSTYDLVKTNERERIVKTFADGSEVTINENSKVWIHKKFKENRTVKLEGEAYFKVARDTSSPFVINMKNTYVKVLGTAFNINNYNEKETTVVTVKSGVVEFGTQKKSGIQPVILHKNQEGWFNKNSMEYSVLEYPHSNKASWKTKHLVFKNSFLVDVAKKLEEVYLVNIKVSEPLKNRKLNATFNDQSIEEIVEIIESTLQIKIINPGKNTYEMLIE